MIGRVMRWATGCRGMGSKYPQVMKRVGKVTLLEDQGKYLMRYLQLLKRMS